MNREMNREMKREELLQVAKPILFNTEMVRAIMQGRKTVTRRVVKPQPDKVLWYSIAGYGHGKWYEEDNIKGRLWTPPCHADDILYVRETWCSAYDGEKYFYFADKCTEREQKKLLNYDDVRWKPSIHMPKEAARIFLKVKRVSVERLQNITKGEVKREGMDRCRGDKCNAQPWCHVKDMPESECFKSLWDSTIKKQDLDKYGWDADPWVWVIEFERIEVE